MLNISSPISCLAYLLLSILIFSIRSEEKKSVNMFIGDAAIGTVGPMGEVKGLMVTGCKVEDHEVG